MNHVQFLVGLSTIGIIGLAFTWQKFWLDLKFTKPIIFDSVFDSVFYSIFDSMR